MGNILTKRNAVIVGLSLLVVGYVMKKGREDSSKGIGSFAKSLGLVA